jgi:hypothetical protein
MGPATLTLSISPTAQVFHIVDALSAWEAYRHSSPYEAWAGDEMPITADEKAMLARHAQRRSRRGAGALDQAFLAEGPIAYAATRAVEQQLLSRADADDERATLDHFAPRLQGLLDAQRANLEATLERIAEVAPRVAPLVTEVARFVDVDAPLRLPVFLVSDPSSTRADAVLHGGAVAVEVLARSDAPPDVDALGTFFHALFHALLATKRESIAIAAKKCDEPVDEETLTEGLAYAVAPGLTSRVLGETTDPLARMVERDRDRPLRVSFVRDERLGLALRAELSSALDGGSARLHDFYPDVCGAWAKVAHAGKMKGARP